MLAIADNAGRRARHYVVAGQWVEATTRGASLFALELMPFEVSNILRRHTLAGILDVTAATLAHTDLVALPIDLYPYTGLANRVWQLRAILTTYDGSYVALAELLAASLITLDERLVRATGPQCPIIAYSKNTSWRVASVTRAFTPAVSTSR